MNVKNNKKDILTHILHYADQMIVFHNKRMQMVIKMGIDDPSKNLECMVEANEHYRTIASYRYLIEPLKDAMLKELPYEARETIFQMSDYLMRVEEDVLKGDTDDGSPIDAGPIEHDVQHDEQPIQD